MTAGRRLSQIEYYLEKEDGMSRAPEPLLRLLRWSDIPKSSGPSRAVMHKLTKSTGFELDVERVFEALKITCQVRRKAGDTIARYHHYYLSGSLANHLYRKLSPICDQLLR